MAWLRDVDRWFIDEILPHRSAYRRQAVRLVAPSDADDLVQEAYARVIGASHHRQIENPRGFMMVVLCNLARERHRRAALVRFEHIADLDTLTMADEAPDQFAIVSNRLELSRLIELMDHLPPRARAVVKLRRIDGMLPRDIAAKLGLSVSTVEKHLANGLAKLAIAMQDAPTRNEKAANSRPWQRKRQQTH